MRKLACLLPLLLADQAQAADWVQIPGYIAHVDIASVRDDLYPSQGTRYASAEPYVVAWVKIGGEETGMAEVAFDCKRGRFGIVQLIVDNETKNSRYQSFDATVQFENYGARMRTIAPDSLYAGAATIACKDKSDTR